MCWFGQILLFILTLSMKSWNLRAVLANHLCLVKSCWLRFGSSQIPTHKIMIPNRKPANNQHLCKLICRSLVILAVLSNQDIFAFTKCYCIFVIGIHVALRLFGYSDFSLNIQICNLSQIDIVEWIHLHPNFKIINSSRWEIRKGWNRRGTSQFQNQTSSMFRWSLEDGRWNI